MTCGMVVWITGLPSSGKSTFAKNLARALERSGVAACTLDGDDVRKAMAPSLGYGPNDRAAFYEMLAGLAALLAVQGLVVLVPATANRRAFRDRARDVAPAFLEVWVDTPAEECARRDSKGLYARAAGGDVKRLPGAGEDYEAPLAADLVAEGGEDAVALAAARERVLRRRSHAPRAAP